ncbi:hypothetical protein [Falsiroseomonas ponticola]|uniref:hypothetical protein n=1 Tax=Falsiroseomonas ponticola TaxID=2786951 RepID=UPI0019346E25|nr:hypothetical protein [Roseomonas ponticola]
MPGVATPGPMHDTQTPTHPATTHGAALLRGLRVEACGHALPSLPAGAERDFDAILAAWRLRHRRGGGRDPFGDIVPEAVEAEALENALAGGTPVAGGLVQGAIEDAAHNLVKIIRACLVRPEWQGTQRVIVGGGFRVARIAELALARAGVLLRAEQLGSAVAAIRHDPAETGLLGAARLLPMRLLEGSDAVLAADLGRRSFRAGLVLPRLGVAPELAAATVWRMERWVHAPEAPDRPRALLGLGAMLRRLAERARQAGLSIAPVIAIGIPAMVEADGALGTGAEALPGDWSAPGFRAAPAIEALLPDRAADIVLHNAAVTYGLSEAPFHRDIARWGVLRIGSDPGHARFTNLPLRR